MRYHGFHTSSRTSSKQSAGRDWFRVGKYGAVAVIATLFLGACAATGPESFEFRKYSPEAFKHPEGFSEKRIGPALFEVQYQANERIGKEKITDFALLRAAQIAKENSYEYFRVLRNRTVARTVGYGNLLVVVLDVELRNQNSPVNTYQAAQVLEKLSGEFL